MFIFKSNFWWIYLRYSIYIVHYTTLPRLEKRRLTCLLKRYVSVWKQPISMPQFWAELVIKVDSTGVV